MACPGAGGEVAWPRRVVHVGVRRQTLRVLHDELAACGLPLTGMLLTRLQAVLMLPGGLVVRCWGSWLIWPAGRPSVCGRPLHTIHPTADPAGAARRLAQASGSRPLGHPHA